MPLPVEASQSSDPPRAEHRYSPPTREQPITCHPIHSYDEGDADCPVRQTDKRRKAAHRSPKRSEIVNLKGSGTEECGGLSEGSSESLNVTPMKGDRCARPSGRSLDRLRDPTASWGYKRLGHRRKRNDVPASDNLTPETTQNQHPPTQSEADNVAQDFSEVEYLLPAPEGRPKQTLQIILPSEPPVWATEGVLRDIHSDTLSQRGSSTPSPTSKMAPQSRNGITSSRTKDEPDHIGPRRTRSSPIQTPSTKRRKMSRSPTISSKMKRTKAFVVNDSEDDSADELAAAGSPLMGTNVRGNRPRRPRHKYELKASTPTDQNDREVQIIEDDDAHDVEIYPITRLYPERGYVRESSRGSSFEAHLNLKNGFLHVFDKLDPRNSVTFEPLILSNIQRAEGSSRIKIDTYERKVIEGQARWYLELQSASSAAPVRIGRVWTRYNSKMKTHLVTIERLDAYFNRAKRKLNEEPIKNYDSKVQTEIQDTGDEEHAARMVNDVLDQRPTSPTFTVSRRPEQNQTPISNSNGRECTPSAITNGKKADSQDEVRLENVIPRDFSSTLRNGQSPAIKIDLDKQPVSTQSLRSRDLVSQGQNPTPNKILGDDVNLEEEVSCLNRWTYENPDWAKQWHSSVFYESRHGKATVHQDDVERLDDGVFLNDNLIEFYLRYLESELQRKSPQVAKRIYIHNTFFYKTLCKKDSQKGTKGINYEAVKRWTRKVDLISYGYIIVPINESSHWYLAIICNASKLLDLRVEQPVLMSDLCTVPQCLDSMRPKSSDRKENMDHDIIEIPDSQDVDMDSGFVLDRLPQNISLQDTDNRRIDLTTENSCHATENRTSLKTYEKNGFFDTDISPSVSLVKDVPESQAQPYLVTHSALNGRNHDHLGGKKSKVHRRTYNLKEPRIITLDSMGQRHSPTCTRLRDYLVAEIWERKEIKVRPPGSLGLTVTGLPQQQNSYDCGIYLLSYVQEFLKQPDEFVGRVLERKDLDIGFQSPDKLRESIREILFKEQAKQTARARQSKETRQGFSGAEPNGDEVKTTFAKSVFG